MTTETPTAASNLLVEKQTAPARYVELIDPSRAPQHGDLDELRRVAAIVGRTPDQVEADSRVLMRAADLREVVRGESDATDRMKASREALEKFDAETKRIEDECREARLKLDHESNEAWSQCDRISQARSELTRLKQNHREAFGLPTQQPTTPACSTPNTMEVYPTEPVYRPGEEPFGPPPGEGDVRTATPW